MNKINLKVVSLLVVGVALFFVGFMVGKKTSLSGPGGLANLSSADLAGLPAGRQARFAQLGGQGGVRGGNVGGLTAGQVIVKDATSVTVKMRDGSSKIVLTSGSTQVLKSDSGTLSDVVVGQEVTITGSANPDGSLTAQSIQIRPAIPQTAPAK